LEGKAQLWLYLKNGIPWGGVVTTSYEDPIMHQRFLYVYSLFAMAQITKTDIDYGLEILRNYAKASLMTGMVAYTNLESIATVISRFGGSSAFTFIYIPV